MLTFLLFCLVFLSVGLILLAQGPFFVPSDDKSASQMLALLKESKTKRIVDLGAGDGKMLILLAKHGYQADGVEINPWLVLKAKRAIRKFGLQKKAKIKWGNFWSYDVSNYDAVLVYAIGHVMAKLEKKLSTELKPGSKIVSNYFVFPNLKPVKQIGRARLYKI